jgi:hypothetical protein
VGKCISSVWHSPRRAAGAAGTTDAMIKTAQGLITTAQSLVSTFNAGEGGHGVGFWGA